MRPCTPHYVLTEADSIVLGKHFFSTSTAMSSCHGIVHSLLANKMVTNTAHPETLHCLVALLEWWIDLRYHNAIREGLDCRSSLPNGVKLLTSCYDFIVLDTIPDERNEAGRDTWLTMACTAIFFDSLNLGTYKVADAANNLQSRSLQQVREGYTGSAVEQKTRERAKIGAAWVFLSIALVGFEKTWKEGAVDRGADPDANDPWYALLELAWAPVRYRYCIRFVLHFACAVVLEQQSLARRGIVDPIHLKHLKERLALDILDFLGGEARDTLEQMMTQAMDRMRQQHQVFCFHYMLYPSNGWVEEAAAPEFRLPWLTDPFNARIECLLEEEVSVQFIFRNTR